MFKKFISIFLSVMLIAGMIAPVGLAIEPDGSSVAANEAAQESSDVLQNESEASTNASEDSQDVSEEALNDSQDVSEDALNDSQNAAEEMPAETNGTQTPVSYQAPKFKDDAHPEYGYEWVNKECTEYTVITSGKDSSYTDGGWYVVNSNVTIAGGLTLGNKDIVTNIILCDDTTLDFKRESIQVGILGTEIIGTVNFYGQTAGTGSFICETSIINSAAIGSAESRSAATLNFYGGKITGTGYNVGPKPCCAGIGYAKKGYHSDTINIYGGEVTGYGGYKAPGIAASADGDGHGLTIYGGKVVATGGESGAGIGGGSEGDRTDIVIYDGEVTAYGGKDAAGIGGGYEGTASNIVIYDGEVTAYGGKNAAGIGGGYKGTASNIIIKGGKINATGESKGAGIGTGHYGTADGITISGGTVTATGGKEAAGIGGAYKSTVKNIEMTGGEVTATGGEYAAGIGGGKESSASDIKISGGKVKATGGNGGAGIGGGYKGTGTLIKIYDGNVEAVGGGTEQGAGIGGGDYGASDGIFIYGGKIKATGVNGSAGIGGGRGAGCGHIYITGGYIEAKGGYWGPAIGLGSNCTGGLGDINIYNAAVKCEAVAGGGYPAMGIGPFTDESKVSCSIKVSGTNTKIWNCDDNTEIENDGGNLSGKLGTSALMITNGTIIPQGGTMTAVGYSDTVSAADKARLEKLMDKFSIKATGNLALLESQYTLAQSILDLSDEEMLKILADPNQHIDLSLVFGATVEMADFSNEKQPVIKYALQTTATAKLYGTGEAVEKSKVMQPDDFDKTQANLEVTMPVPAGCEPSVILHTSDNDDVVYDEFKPENYDCVYDTTEQTVTVYIPHCSHLVSYFESANPGTGIDTGDDSFLISILLITIAAGLGVVALRKRTLQK